ncbi:MAG: hypothetical protein AAFX08_08930 [Pseudomonadota bacterium]
MVSGDAKPILATTDKEAAATVDTSQDRMDSVLARLDGFLDTVPLSASTKLFAAVERRPIEAPGEASVADDAVAAADADALDALPRNRLLALLRRRLPSSEHFPARKTDARRAFYSPFDAFFVHSRAGAKRVGRIPRTSLAPIWRFLTRRDDCAGSAAAARSLEEALVAASDSGERGQSKAAAARALASADADLRRAVSADLAGVARRANSDPSARNLYCVFLGGNEGADAGAPIFDDMMEIARLLPLASTLTAARARFPLGMKSLSDAGMRDAEAFFFDAVNDHPQDASYIPMFFAGRMAQPWSALPLYYRLRGAPAADPLLDLVFDDLESIVRRLEREVADMDGLRDAIARFERVAAFADGVASVADQNGDGAALARVEASRDLSATSLARAAEHAKATLRAMMPLRGAKGSTMLVALRPDYESPLCAAQIRAAASAAAFLAETERLAGALARPWAGEGADDVTKQIDRYANDLVREIRAAEGAARAKAKERMERLMDAAAPLIDREAGALLKERAAAAALAG